MGQIMHTPPAPSRWLPAGRDAPPPRQGGILLLPSHSVVGDPDDDQDDPNGLQERIYVQPREFQVYEFGEKLGQLYVTAPEFTMRQVLRGKCKTGQPR